jgi:hypothetical protein
MSQQTAAVMEDWLAANPKGKHGKHSYSSEEYGISDADVRTAFADYIARYDL